ncbi:MAG: DivIVA domain-containing protein [Actinobacteria bacterium]|nr:DivIVA domain-containing protein [Actinomycetota bacterium]
MSYTPVEIRHLKLRRGLLGYRRGGVDAVLEEVADSFENVWRDRADLQDRVEHLDSELVRHRELEALLRTTLVSAERAAHDLRDQAKHDSDRILAEARAEARAILREAGSEGERLRVEATRVRALLGAALEVVRDAEPAPDEAEGKTAGVRAA